MSSKILKGRDINSSITDKNLGHFFLNQCRKHGHRICQIDGMSGETETYESVRLRTTRVALALKKRKIAPGDAITICSFNTIDNIIPIIAGLCVGAKISNMDPSLSARYIKHLLNLIEPKIIFATEQSLTLFEECVETLTLKPEIVVVGSSNKYDIFENFLKPQEDEEEFKSSDMDADETALMYFSSGTTGLPKVICHTHRSALTFIVHACEIGWGNNALHCSTFHWLTAVMIALGSFHLGNFFVFCLSSNSEDIFRIIEKYKNRHLFMAPVATYGLTRFEDPRKYDTSSLQAISVGGSPISACQLEKIGDTFPSATVYQVYGMTEIGLVTSFPANVDKDFAKKKISSSGTVISGCQIKIVDPNSGENLGPYQRGEICAYTPARMKGYYKVDSPQLFDEDGFVKTGDIGYYDEDGCLYVVERLKEMLKYRACQIIPSLVESVLLEHPSIKEAVVFGIPHEEDGDLVTACVVLKDDHSLSENEIDKFIQARLTDRERLRGGVTFMETLPQTPSGKVNRRLIRDMILSSLPNHA